MLARTRSSTCRRKRVATPGEDFWRGGAWGLVVLSGGRTKRKAQLRGTINPLMSRTSTIIAGVLAATLFVGCEEQVHELPAVVKNGQTIRLTANSPAPVQPLVSERIEVSGTVAFTESVFIVTERFTGVGSDATLRAPEILVFATQMDGVRLDSSPLKGEDGDDAKERGGAGDNGNNGASGGDIFVAAGRVDNSPLIASGSRGGDGGKGARGHKGRNGDCAGFGGWVGALDGGDGGRGGDGGNGGNGGRITVIVTGGQLRGPQPVVRGGPGGAPGRGGPGGNGGRGCSGLGGVQSSHPDGAPGANGQPGAVGLPGDVVTFPHSFSEVAEAISTLAAYLGDRDLVDARTLKGVIQKLTATEEAESE